MQSSGLLVTRKKSTPNVRNMFGQSLAVFSLLFADSFLRCALFCKKSFFFSVIEHVFYSRLVSADRSPPSALRMTPAPTAFQAAAEACSL